MSDNPYAAPETEVSVDGVPALWNPGAAANWSLLLTPVFGSFLHWRNWRAIGEREDGAQMWFVVSLFMLFPTMIIPGIGLLWLVIWYFGAARRQVRAVRERWSDDYPRQPWGLPLVVGFGFAVALWAIKASVLATMG